MSFIENIEQNKYDLICYIDKLYKNAKLFISQVSLKYLPHEARTCFVENQIGWRFDYIWEYESFVIVLFPDTIVINYFDFTQDNELHTYTLNKEAIVEFNWLNSLFDDYNNNIDIVKKYSFLDEGIINDYADRFKFI